MPAPYYYYVFPFGQEADDLTAIPTNTAGDGSVSYEQGWTDPYELNLLTDPDALPIPRGQMNQLFFDITNNLQQYQQYGTPIWVTGNTVSYPIFSRVYSSGIVYESQIANNTNTPGADSTWRIISGSVDGVPIGAILDFGSATAPTGYLNCDGAAHLRSSFASLFSAITFAQTGTLTNTANTVTGLSSTTNMFVGMNIEGTGIPAGTTVATIASGTSITMSANATTSGAQSITFFPWGNGNGSTSFNVPDLRRRTTAGSGGTASTDPLGVGNVVGAMGGEEAHTQTIPELVGHTHAVGALLTQSPPGTQIQGGSNWQQTANVTSGSTGGGDAFNIIQPTAITYKIIKYS